MSQLVSVKRLDILNILKADIFRNRSKLYGKIVDYIITDKKLEDSEKIRVTIKKQLQKFMTSISSFRRRLPTNKKSYKFIESSNADWFNQDAIFDLTEEAINKYYIPSSEKKPIGRQRKPFEECSTSTQRKRLREMKEAQEDEPSQKRLRRN